MCVSLSLPLLLSLPPRSGPAPRDVVVRGQDLAEMHDLGGAWQGGKLEEEGGELGEQAPRRTEWPELLGADAGRAREAILRDQPDLRVDIVRQPEDANAGDQANKVQPDARVRPTRAVARHDAPIVSARTHMPATSRHTCMRVSYVRVSTRSHNRRTRACYVSAWRHVRPYRAHSPKRAQVWIYADESMRVSRIPRVGG